MFFDTSCISDYNTLNVLKLYRSIATALKYSNSKRFDNLLPQIEKYTLSTKKLFSDDKPCDVFMSALQECRTLPNRIVCKYNDRGYKVSYFQTFEYDLRKITNVIEQFKGYDSAYKNFCLYTAINLINNADVMLLQTLKGVCEHKYDVFKDETECWAAAMSALRLLDYYYLTNTISQTLPLTKLCLHLLNIYIKNHASEDKLRLMECYANRARLIERFYKVSYFVVVMGEYSGRLVTNPVLLKYLCMYDWEQAKRNVPQELVGEASENYNNFASQLMMYQNQGLGRVLPDGDPFDTSFGNMKIIGATLALEINDMIDLLSDSIFSGFLQCYSESEKQLRSLVNSYYQRQGAVNDDKLSNFYCISWYHQLESYTIYGRMKAVFHPIKYHIDNFLKNINIDKDEIEYKCKNNIGIRYMIHNFNRIPQMMEYHGRTPYIGILLVQTDEDGYLKSFRCYGQNLKEWIRELSCFHMFFGVAVRPINKELYRFPETVTLTVCFQIENDINK